MPFPKVSHEPAKLLQLRGRLTLVIPWLVGVRLLPSSWLHDGETSNATPP